MWKHDRWALVPYLDIKSLARCLAGRTSPAEKYLDSWASLIRIPYLGSFLPNLTIEKAYRPSSLYTGIQITAESSTGAAMVAWMIGCLFRIMAGCTLR